MSSAQLGEAQEPSARKLAAEAARIAGSKLARGFSNSFKATPLYS